MILLVQYTQTFRARSYVARLKRELSKINVNKPQYPTYMYLRYCTGNAAEHNWDISDVQTRCNVNNHL